MKKIESIGVSKVASKLLELNTGNLSYLFTVRHYGEDSIVTDLDMSHAIFPEGYYFNRKNGITNKHNTTNGHYETIGVYKLVEV